MNGTLRRLDRLTYLAQPPGCRWLGQRCWRTEVIGDGSDDPAVPILAARCPTCGRETVTQVILVAGVDVSRI